MITLTPSNALPNTYSLNWNAQQSHIFDGLRSLVGQDDILLTDVTLACDGEYIQAHKLVLSLCSSFFKDLFKKNKADKSNTIVILGNVSALNLKYLLQFMYQGNVDIPSKDVDSFLQAGNLLKIEGLIRNVNETAQVPCDPPNVSHHHQTQHQQTAQTNEAPTISQRSQRTHAVPTTVATTVPNKISLPSSSAKCDSPPTLNKKPRLTQEPSTSGSSIITSGSIPDAAPVIVGEPVSISVASNQAHSSSSGVLDPLDDSEQYEPGDMEGDGEEGIDFNNLKAEPIQVYSGYEESEETEMMQHERIGEDSYGGSIDDNYGLPPPPASLQLPIASLSNVSVPGPSTSSQSVGRPRGSLPGYKRRYRSPQSAAANSAKQLQVPRKCFSGVWMYFKRLGGLQALCCLCHVVINRNNPSTTLLRRHLMTRHLIEFQAAKRNRTRR